MQRYWPCPMSRISLKYYQTSLDNRRFFILPNTDFLFRVVSFFHLANTFPEALPCSRRCGREHEPSLPLRSSLLTRVTGDANADDASNEWPHRDGHKCKCQETPLDGLAGCLLFAGLTSGGRVDEVASQRWP